MAFRPPPAGRGMAFRPPPAGMGMAVAVGQEIPVAASHIAYDWYVLDNGDGYGNHHFRDEGMTLQDFVFGYQLRMVVNRHSIARNLPMLPGEIYNTDYVVSSELCKKASRSLLEKLRKLELLGCCLYNFGPHSVRFYPNGKVKFSGVVNHDLPHFVLLQHLHDHYNIAADIIMSFFGGQSIPADMQHLIDLLRHDFGARELFHIHSALCPLSTYTSLFKEVYNYARFILPKHQLCQILASLPNVDQWQALVQTNELLEITLNYSGPNRYQVPADDLNQQALNNHQVNALAKLELAQLPNQVSLTPQQIALIMALNLLDFLRNKGAHKMEPLRQWIQTHLVASDAQGADLVTCVRFDIVLPIIQLWLRWFGVLNNLDLGDFF